MTRHERRMIRKFPDLAAKIMADGCIGITSPFARVALKRAFRAMIGNGLRPVVIEITRQEGEALPGKAPGTAPDGARWWLGVGLDAADHQSWCCLWTASISLPEEEERNAAEVHVLEQLSVGLNSRAGIMVSTKFGIVSTPAATGLLPEVSGIRMPLFAEDFLRALIDEGMRRSPSQVDRQANRLKQMDDQKITLQEAILLVLTPDGSPDDPMGCYAGHEWTKDDLVAFHYSRLWITARSFGRSTGGYLPQMNRRMTSYGFKHRVEEWLTATGEPRYIPHGAFIVAALISGILRVPCGINAYHDASIK